MLDTTKIKKDLTDTLAKEGFEKIFDFFEFLDEQKIYDIINKSSIDNIKNLYAAINFYYYFNLVVDKRASPLKALLMLFVIEGATFGRNYLDFYGWLNNKLNLLINKNEIELKQSMDILYEEYKTDYGSSRNFRQLFQKYLELGEKLDLLRSYSFEDNGKINHLCSNAEQQCCVKGKQKNCDYLQCYLLNNSKKTDIYVKKMVDMLYQVRSELAHNAKLCHFTYMPKEGYLGMLIHSFNGKQLIIELTYDSFEDIAKKIISRYLIAH